MLMSVEDFVTTSQAAELARVDRATIRKWVSRGHLEPVKTPDGEAARHPETGENLFKLIDVAKAEHKTRRRARRSLAQAA